MVMRVTGLASGMNIDEIVTNLIKAESIPLNKMKQEKTLLEWKRDAYREINTMVLNFRSELTNMKLSSFYRTRSVTSTNESLISATVSSGAGQGSYTISNISQLASAASLVNAGGISADQNQKVDINKSLYSIKDSFKFGDSSSDFGWKTGSVETKSIVTKASGKEFSLELNSEVNIIDTENMTVSVDGKKFTVIGVDSANFEATKASISTGQVLVDRETGKLYFGDDIKANSSIKADFVANQRIDTININDEVTEISLRGSLVEGSVRLSIGEKSFEQGTDNKIYLKNADGTLSTEAYGEIDYETGKIKVYDNFRSLVKDEITAANPEWPTDSDTKPTIEIKAYSQQNYLSFGMTTQTLKGEVKETFLVQGSESLNTVMNRVNNSQLGLTMFYDSFTDQITMTRKETGDFKAGANDIEFSGTFLSNVLQFNENAAYTEGANAIFTINGLQTERNSNTFMMNGVTFTLKNTTVVNGVDSGEKITVNVNEDTDKLFGNIKSFVDKYNELVGKIEEKLKEPKYKDYLPLTDDERETLSDKQQEQWEEMAKSGLLKNDSILSGLLNQMRTSIYFPVSQGDLDPTMKTLSAIGITTTSDYQSAKLEIDETKLKEAIAKDPASIELLFNGTGTTESQKGIMHRLTDKINVAMEQLKERAGNTFSVNNQFTIGRQLDSLDDRIERFEDRLTTLETRYYNQFTQMEKMIQQANSQSAYLSQFFM